MKRNTLIKNEINCRHYEYCSAPLCPRDTDLGKCIWFPDEPICDLRNVPDWVRKQRKIAKTSDMDLDKFFTIGMLEEVTMNDIEYKGLDPDYYISGIENR